MKRILSVLFALLLGALPAFAEAEFSTFDYRTGSSGGGRFLYYDFPDISLMLPGEWEDRFCVEASDDGAAFYHLASHELFLNEGSATGGLLFKLCACAEESYRDLPACEYLGYSEQAGLHFYLSLPTDDAAWPEEPMHSDYAAMAAQVDVVVEHARIAPSLSFYTEGVESTDAGMS